MGDTATSAAEAVAAVERIDSVPTLLNVICGMSGMRFAAVVAVIDDSWTPCAVKDDVPLGIRPGVRLRLTDALCSASGRTRTPLVIEHAGRDPRYSNHPMTLRHGVESYLSVPIVLESGRRFGRLCALDPRATPLAAANIVSMFEQFAALIAIRLDDQLRQQLEHTALLDERAASELREQFIAILGHDLRNPLQAIYAGSELLERKLKDADLRIHASRIRTHARRMSVLIDDVLDFARGRLGGGIGLELTDTDNVNAGLTTVIQELRDGQPDREITANIDVNRSVRCDLGRLQQVASNLLGNALTHGDAHTAVRIDAHADERDLVLEVWNAGAPIPAESIDKIFEPFWRHSVSASRNGLGLGLHICSQIIRAHAGSIAVTSTRANGTRFTARLPLGDPPAPALCAVAYRG
jgi:signal transduction histidine kinase